MKEIAQAPPPKGESPEGAPRGIQEVKQNTVRSQRQTDTATFERMAQADAVSIITGDKLLAKVWQASGEIADYDNAKNFRLRTETVANIQELSALLRSIESDSHTAIIRGGAISYDLAEPQMRGVKYWIPGRYLRRQSVFKDRSLHMICLDVDGFRSTRGDPLTDTRSCCDEFIAKVLPDCFQGASYHWQLSNSAGAPQHAGLLKVHLWFWLKTPYTSAMLRPWAMTFGKAFDDSLYEEIQLHYTAAPVFEAGARDPVPARSGLADGWMSDSVDLVLQQAEACDLAEVFDDLRETDPVVAALYSRGLVKNEIPRGGLNIRCPRESEHSSGTTEGTATIYYPAHTGGYAHGAFVCQHAHCKGQPQGLFKEALGIHAALDFEDEQLDSNPLPPTALNAFESHMPSGKYILRATNEHWPGASVNQSVTLWPKGKRKVVKKGLVTFEDGDVPPTDWLDKNRPVHQTAWMPGYPVIVNGTLLQEGGTTDAPGHRLYNLYKPGPELDGDASHAGPWLDLVRAVYPEHYEHIILWLAQRCQQPHVKVNHAIVLGGPPGIGKDTLLEPVKHVIGAWNWSDISPHAAMGRFNGWAKAVVVRVSEARDLGDVNRHQLYEGLKTYQAAPPDAIRVDEKNLREHYVLNVLGMVLTTNNRSDGLYLPADDRRHYVAWSERTKETFAEGFWKGIYDWYEAGGIGHVAAYLRGLDISTFDPKAPPPLTRDFWLIVQSGEAPENAEFRDLVDALEHKEAFTLGDLARTAERLGMPHVAMELRDRRTRRSIGHKFVAIGYGAVRNPDAKEGYWSVRGKRQAIYCRLDKPVNEQVRLCRDLQIRATREADGVPPDLF